MARIRCTAFTGTVDKFYRVMQQGEVYILSKASPVIERSAGCWADNPAGCRSISLLSLALLTRLRVLLYEVQDCGGVWCTHTFLCALGIMGAMSARSA